MMNMNLLFYPVYLLDSNDEQIAFRGTAFPIAPGGTFLTCKHVVNGELGVEINLALKDPASGEWVKGEKISISHDAHLDLALFSNWIPQKEEFLPILSPDVPPIGKEVSSVGYYAHGGTINQVSRGHFSGRVVNVFEDQARNGQPRMTLPYPIIEGMSGSPVYTNHSGTKVVGVGVGSEQHRIVASEVVEVNDNGHEFRETINRIVEFGIAIHSIVLIRFLEECSVSGFVVSKDRLEIPGID